MELIIKGGANEPTPHKPILTITKKLYIVPGSHRVSPGLKKGATMPIQDLTIIIIKHRQCGFLEAYEIARGYLS